jgi:trigger factor
VETEKVDAAFEEVTREFQKHARSAGFPGRESAAASGHEGFTPQIDDEVRRKLLSESFREALREQQLTLVGRPEVEETQFGRGQPLQFTATFETAPEFELPDYKGLPVRREVRIVTPEDVERAVGILLEQRVTYVDVARPVQTGDFVVVNYQGTCDGKPITEIAPTARGLTEKKDFWVHVAEGSFIPGFTEQLVGASAGEKRTVTVQYPADFVASQLAGLTGVYEVEIVQVKEKQLPELNDALAQAYGAETVEQLRAGVQRDLENELRHKQKRDTRDQLVRELLNRVTCELPESVVSSETKNAVYDIVRENQERGVSRESIDQNKEQIFAVANNSAKDRVKASFVLGRIAAKEGIKAERDEVARRVDAAGGALPDQAGADDQAIPGAQRLRRGRGTDHLGQGVGLPRGSTPDSRRSCRARRSEDALDVWMPQEQTPDSMSHMRHRIGTGFLWGAGDRFRRGVGRPVW